MIFLITLSLISVGCAEFGITGHSNEVLGKVLSKKVLSTDNEKKESINEQIQEFGTALILTANHSFSICVLFSNCAAETHITLAQYKVELRGGEVIEVFSDHGFFRIGDCVLVYKVKNEKKMVLARSCRGFS